MAQSNSADNLIEQVGPGPGRKRGKYCYGGRLLKIAEIEAFMDEKERHMSPGDRVQCLAMLRTIRAVKDNPIVRCMSGCNIPFSVSQLQHVTGKEGFDGITRNGTFTGKNKPIYINGREVWCQFSWWSVLVPKTTCTSIRRKGCEELSSYNPCVAMKAMQRKTMNQFANSPVFKNGSRYGNFKFSFSVDELLSAYIAQHCPGQALVFRVLGTWTYQQEILHGILIHGPDYNHKFCDLPEITNNATEPFYRMEDGTVMCSLESSSIKFTLKIASREGVVEELGQYADQCVWNNPAYAFYLPGRGSGLQLNISREKVTACKNIRPYMQTRGTPTPVPKANQIIQDHFTAQRNE